MFHLDGSEIAWLVYADWLEDQHKDSSGVRRALEEQYETNQWHNESRANRGMGIVGWGGDPGPFGGDNNVGFTGGVNGHASFRENQVGCGLDNNTRYRRISIPLVNRIYPDL